MKVLKVIACSIVALVVLNVLSWLFVGRTSALLLTASDFDGWGALTGEQVLHLHASTSHGQPPGWREAGDFPARVRERLARLYVETGRAAEVAYHPESLTELPDNLADGHFILAVAVRSLPLYAETLSAVYAPGFVSDRRRAWIWVFGWQSLGYGEISVS